MRVAFDHQIFSAQRFGGVSRYFYEIAWRLARSLEVEVIAPLYINAYLAHRSDLVRGVKVPRLPRSTRATALIDDALSRILLRPRTDIDILHETYYGTADHRPRSARRVITIHDMTHEKFPAAFPRRDPTARLKALAVSRADHIICVSENTRRDLLEVLGVSRSRTSVVHHGHSLEGVAPRPSTLDRPFLLYVGARGGYKNFAGLLRAYAGSPALRDAVAIVCFGGGSLGGLERSLIRSLGLAPASVLQCSGGDDILAGLYTAAVALVYPSRYEGFGMPPLEAMSLGCPTICSNASSLPEVVGEAAELFDPDDDAAMRVAIERVVAAPSRARELAAAGRQRAAAFSWDRCAAETLDAYQKS